MFRLGAAANKKSRRDTDNCRTRWRLGWHGGYPATAPWLCVTAFRRIYSGQRGARDPYTRIMPKLTTLALREACFACYKLDAPTRRQSREMAPETLILMSDY